MALAAQHRLPTVYSDPYFVPAGGPEAVRRRAKIPQRSNLVSHLKFTGGADPHAVERTCSN